MELQRYTDALEAARMAGALEPIHADPPGVQGQAYAALGDDDAAEKAFRAALRLRRERWFLPLLAGLQAVYARQGRIWAARRLRVIVAVRGLIERWRLRDLHRQFRADRLRMEAKLTGATDLPPDIYGLEGS